MAKRYPVLNVGIDPLTWDTATLSIAAWANQHESRYVCICNVHSVVTAEGDPEFRLILQCADLVTADGAPIAWAVSRLQHKKQERINGPDLMWRYLRIAEQLHHKIYFYGGSETSLQKLLEVVRQHFPHLQIAGAFSPPYRSLSASENQAHAEMINQSGAHVVFVGLGCPKQERWMAAQNGSVRAVMIGVGAAFDYHAGTLKRAPLAWQRSGFEWLYRLLQEPRRLFKRYLVTNTLFMVRMSRQILLKLFKPEPEKLANKKRI